MGGLQTERTYLVDAAHPLFQGESEVKLALYNPLGTRVKILKDGVLSPGWYKTELNLRKEGFASGVYWLILEQPSKRIVKKLILLR